MLCKHTQNICKNCPIMGHKASVRKFHRTQKIKYVVSDHKAFVLNINLLKRTRNFLFVSKLRNEFLNNLWVKKETIIEIRKHFKWMVTKIIHSLSWDNYVFMWKNIEIDPKLTPHTKINSKWITAVFRLQIIIMTWG